MATKAMQTLCCPNQSPPILYIFFYRNRGHLTLMRYFSVTLLPFNSFSLSEVSGIKPGPTITKQAARQIYFYYKDDVLTFLDFFIVLSLLKLS
jgi:hypothetical protein